VFNKRNIMRLNIMLLIRVTCSRHNGAHLLITHNFPNGVAQEELLRDPDAKPERIASFGRGGDLTELQGRAFWILSHRLQCEASR